MPRPSLLELGYVSRAHGIRGEVAVRPFDPASEALYEVDAVTLVPRSGPERTARIVNARGAKGDVILELAGVDGRSAAEALVGSRVLVERGELEPPGEGEFFQGDLIGLAAFDEAGRALGKVEEVWNTGPVPNLVIRGGGRELLVPFADDFVPVVDLENGRLVVREPEVVE